MTIGHAYEAGVRGGMSAKRREQIKEDRRRQTTGGATMEVDHEVQRMWRTAGGRWELECRCGEVLGPLRDPIECHHAHQLHAIDQHHADVEGRPAPHALSEVG